jgi:hypothetical protein
MMEMSAALMLPLALVLPIRMLIRITTLSPPLTPKSVTLVVRALAVESERPGDKPKTFSLLMLVTAQINV